MEGEGFTFGCAPPIPLGPGAFGTVNSGSIHLVEVPVEVCASGWQMVAYPESPATTLPPVTVPAVTVPPPTPAVAVTPAPAASPDLNLTAAAVIFAGTVVPIILAVLLLTARDRIRARRIAQVDGTSERRIARHDSWS